MEENCKEGSSTDAQIASSAGIKNSTNQNADETCESKIPKMAERKPCEEYLQDKNTCGALKSFSQIEQDQPEDETSAIKSNNRKSSSTQQQNQTESKANCFCSSQFNSSESNYIKGNIIGNEENVSSKITPQNQPSANNEITNELTVTNIVSGNKDDIDNKRLLQIKAGTTQKQKEGAKYKHKDTKKSENQIVSNAVQLKSPANCTQEQGDLHISEPTTFSTTVQMVPCVQENQLAEINPNKIDFHTVIEIKNMRVIKSNIRAGIEIFVPSEGIFEEQQQAYQQYRLCDSETSLVFGIGLIIVIVACIVCGLIYKFWPNFERNHK